MDKRVMIVRVVAVALLASSAASNTKMCLEDDQGACVNRRRSEPWRMRSPRAQNSCAWSPKAQRCMPKSCVFDPAALLHQAREDNLTRAAHSPLTRFTIRRVPLIRRALIKNLSSACVPASARRSDRRRPAPASSPSQCVPNAEKHRPNKPLRIHGESVHARACQCFSVLGCTLSSCTGPRVVQLAAYQTLLDTGAATSAVTNQLAKKLNLRPEPFQTVEIHGIVPGASVRCNVAWLVVEIRGWCVLEQVAIVKGMAGHDLILGRNVLRKLVHEGRPMPLV